MLAGKMLKMQLLLGCICDLVPSALECGCYRDET
jgi:hypothetical protein